jgi:EpsI family protein
MRLFRALVLSLSMVGASAAAVYLTPKQLYTKDYRPEVTLEQMIPSQFGTWRVDAGQPQQVVNPTVQVQLAQLYSDSLSRVYVNAQGERIMLSLAYGADQSRAMQVHKPEVCYDAQGFKIVASRKSDAQYGGAPVPIMRLIAKNGPRNEPISYWIRSGDYLVRGWLEQNIARVKNGLIKGHVPDGLLVRVSTIDTDAEAAYKLQDQFMTELLSSSSLQARTMLLGEAAQRF